jgi:hypothetical protein
MMHKTYHLSALKDAAPSNHRTTACGRIVKNTEVKARWVYVTCEECLYFRDPKLRKLRVIHGRGFRK